MDARSAGLQQPVHLSSSQEIGHICKPDSSQTQHTDLDNKLEIDSSNEAEPMHAMLYSKSLSLDSSAASHKIVRPVATRAQPRHPGSYSSVHSRTQHGRPVASFSQSILSDRSGLTHHRRCRDSGSTDKLTLATRYLHLHHQLQANLAGAHAVGYCNGIRHTGADTRLTFCRDEVSLPSNPAAANNQPHVQQGEQHTQHRDVPTAEAEAASATQDRHAPLHVLHGRPIISQHQEPHAHQLLHGKAQQEPEQAQQHLHRTHLPHHLQLGFVPHAMANQLQPTDQQSSSPKVMQGGMQTQAGSLLTSVDGSIEKRKCIISKGSSTMGNSPDKLVKFRCNIRDILDTSFPGWDASTAHTDESDAASNVSATSSAETATLSTPSATHPALVRVPISHLTTPSALLSTSSSTNSHPDDSATLTEEEARRAMPPPRGRRATAESVQAAVAAAQQEEWATVAQAAAWGSSFPGAGPFAQLGPAAWNIAFPQQVFDTVACGSNSRANQHTALHAGGAPATPYLPNPSEFVPAETGIPHPLSLPQFPHYPLEAFLPRPHPWGPSTCPYVLSSLPQVMHQLLEEPSIDFLQSWSLPVPAPVSSQVRNPDLGTEQLPAKKQCKDRRQLPTSQQESEFGDRPRQTAGGQGAVAQQQSSGQQNLDRQSGAVDMDISDMHQADQLQASGSQQQPTDSTGGLQPTVPASSQDNHAAEAGPTPLQLMKHRARQRVAAAIAPEEDGCRHAGMPH